MTPFRLLISGLLFCALILGIYFFRPAPDPSLSLLLRCSPQVEGELTISGSAIDTQPTLSVTELCAANSITFEDFKRDAPISIIYSNEAGEMTRIDLQKPDNIQTEHDGTYSVLIDITTSPPFIAIGTV